jgi:hypothetical protein
VAEPQPIGDFLKGILRQTGRSSSRRAYDEALDKLLPQQHRDHCQIVGWRNNRLVVEVDSAPLFAELSGFRRESLRLAINELTPDQPIAQLTFRLGGTGHV